MKSRAANLIATWFGCGYAPVAPGTAGSLAALAIAWLLVHYAGWRPFWFLALVLVATAPAIWAAGVTARERQPEGPGLVVVDEVLGQWLALAGAAPSESQVVDWRLRAVPPVRYLEARAGPPISKACPAAPASWRTI